MTKYALIQNNEILEFRNYAPNVNQSELPNHKPKMLVVEIEEEDFNPVSQIKEGPTYEIESFRVIEKYTSRDKNLEEIRAMIDRKNDEIENEFFRLYNLPILHEVSGVEYTFHADAQARENITGVLQMYYEADRLGPPLPDPRPWTPMGEGGPVQITRAELALLGMAIGIRKDALYTIKKTKQASLAIMTDPADIDAVDPLTGWEIT